MDIKKISKITLFLLILLTLCAIGLTYAYFTSGANHNKEDESTIVRGGKLEITYGDGNGLLSIEHLKPNQTVGEKTFTVTNTGRNDVDTYDVILEDVINELEYYEDLEYTLTCSSDKGTCNGNNGVFPKNDSVLISNPIKVGETQSYKLTVKYNETYKDQSNDMNKYVLAKVNLKNEESYLSTFKIYGNTTLVNNEFNDVGDKTKNLFNMSKTINGSTILDNGDGSLTVKKYPASSKKLFELAPDLKTGDTIVFSMVTNGYPQIYLYNSQTKNHWYLNSGSTITLTQEILNSLVYLYKQTNAQGGNDSIISNMQMELGETKTEYEPYGYRIPISITGKNLININELCGSLDENGDYVCSAKSENYIISNVKPNTRYTLSGTIKNTGVTNSYPRLYFMYTDGTDASNTGSELKNYTDEYIFKTATSANGKTINGLQLGYNIGGGYYHIKDGKLQLEEGTKSTEYEPYYNEIINLYLNKPLRKVGNIADYVDIKNGEVVRRIGVIDSYNGEKIDTDYTSSTGSLTTGAKVYYVLDEEQTEKVDTTNILKKVKLNGSVSANTNLSPYKIEFIVL